MSTPWNKKRSSTESLSLMVAEQKGGWQTRIQGTSTRKASPFLPYHKEKGGHKGANEL